MKKPLVIRVLTLFLFIGVLSSFVAYKSGARVPAWSGSNNLPELSPLDTPDIPQLSDSVVYNSPSLNMMGSSKTMSRSLSKKHIKQIEAWSRERAKRQDSINRAQKNQRGPQK